MRRLLRVVKLLGVILPLLAILGISVYVVLQNQDIRNKAGSSKEFLQMTQAKLLKHRRALVRVVVNNLQSHLYYRAVVTVSYTPNPQHPPPEGTKAPSERKRTMRIKDNKTYPFLVKLQSCYFVPHISVKLYSRERGKKYAEIPFDGNVTTTDLTPPCSVTKIQPTAKPQESQTSQNSSESASQQVQPTEEVKPLEITNGDIPDDAGEETSEEATDLDAIEDIGALEKESNEASQEMQTALVPSAIPTSIPSAQSSSQPSTSGVTAKSGSFTFNEGIVTYDCTNPSSVTRHIHTVVSPKGSAAKLKVTSYVDASTPKIPERTIYENLVHDDETVAVTMNETPSKGFGNVFFAATLYFADGNYVPLGSGANVGWQYNCPKISPTLQPTTAAAKTAPTATKTPIPPTPKPTAKSGTVSQIVPTTLPTAVPTTGTSQQQINPTVKVATPTTTGQQSLAALIATPVPTAPGVQQNTTSQPAQILPTNTPSATDAVLALLQKITPPQQTPTTSSTSTSTSTSTQQPSTTKELVQQSNQQTQQVTFGSLSNPVPTTAPQLALAPTTPTPSKKGTTPISPSPTSIQAPPLADFAGRSYAETNATPTPFPIFHPVITTTPASMMGQLAQALPGRGSNNNVSQTQDSQNENPLVPESPKSSGSSGFFLFDWIRFIFNSIVQFFTLMIAGIKQVLGNMLNR